jgi:hypothetical protein
MLKSYQADNAHQEAVHRDMHTDVDREKFQEVNPDSAAAACRERNDKVKWIVTEADFK